MSAYVIEWLSLLGRWVHLITGIAWIGSSFYFVWLDNHLTAPTDESLARKGVGGELWAVHGGGFYNAQKYRVAPQTLPNHCTGSTGRPTPRSCPGFSCSDSCTTRRRKSI